MVGTKKYKERDGEIKERNGELNQLRVYPKLVGDVDSRNEISMVGVHG